MEDKELAKKKFDRLLHKYVSFRGIDIVLYLTDGSIIELDKNRYIEGNQIIKKNSKQQIERVIEIDHIKKADFFAA